LNEVQREALLAFYLKHLNTGSETNKENFTRYFFAFALIRILQALGAYGYRGIFEKKPNFRSSIPRAIENLSHLFDQNKIPVSLPELQRISGFLKEKQSEFLGVLGYSEKGYPNYASLDAVFESLVGQKLYSLDFIYSVVK